MGVPGNRALLACSIKMPCKWRITFDAAPGKRAKGAMNRGIFGRPWDLSQAKSACFFRGSHEKQHPKSISGMEHATLAKWPPSPSIELGPLGVSAPPKEEKTVFWGAGVSRGCVFVPPKTTCFARWASPIPKKTPAGAHLEVSRFVFVGGPAPGVHIHQRHRAPQPRSPENGPHASDAACVRRGCDAQSGAILGFTHRSLHASEGDAMHKASHHLSPLGRFPF